MMDRSASETTPKCVGNHKTVDHILTVDLEDWFHGIDRTDAKILIRRVGKVTGRLLDLLEAHHARATFFVLGEVAHSSPGLIREITNCGHALGTHGMRHRHVDKLGPEGFRQDLRDSIHAIEDATGAMVKAHRAPYFSINSAMAWSFDVLAEEGITLDASLFPIWIPGRGDSTAPRLPHEIRPGLLEWPMTSLPLRVAGQSFGSWPFSGGSYMRLLPFALFRWATQQVEARGEAVILYVHPYEFDDDHPPPRLRERLRPRFLRLPACESKLEWALARARHISLQDAADAWWLARRHPLGTRTVRIAR